MNPSTLAGLGFRAIAGISETPPTTSGGLLLSFSKMQAGFAPCQIPGPTAGGRLPRGELNPSIWQRFSGVGAEHTRRRASVRAMFLGDNQ